MLAQTGCSAIFSGDAGYAHAFAQAPERSAATTNVYVGAGAGDASTGIGVGDALGIRTKWSDAVQQVSLAEALYFIVATHSDDPAAAFFGLGGFHLFTFESIAGITSASIGSPFVELAGYVRIAGHYGITAGVSFEDDIRFIDLPSTGYVGFTLGFGVIRFRGNIR